MIDIVDQETPPPPERDEAPGRRAWDHEDTFLAVALLTLLLGPALLTGLLVTVAAGPTLGALAFLAALALTLAKLLAG